MQITIEELKKLPLWVNWKYQDRDGGKRTKVPVNAKTGGNADYMSLCCCQLFYYKSLHKIVYDIYDRYIDATMDFGGKI